MGSRGSKGFGSVLVLVLTSVLGSCTSNSGSITLANKSSEPIAHAEISICRQTLTIDDLAVGQEANRNYRVNCEDGYSVRVRFQSGREISNDDIGYVTGGMDFRHTLIVTDRELQIDFRQ
jgi:hypothetical protein